MYQLTAAQSTFVLIAAAVCLVVAVIVVVTTAPRLHRERTATRTLARIRRLSGAWKGRDPAFVGLVKRELEHFEIETGLQLRNLDAQEHQAELVG